jgi:hypothetical protein
VKTALEAMANTGVGDVIVTGGPLPATPVFVEYTQTYYQQAVTIPVGSGSLTGGGSAVSTVTQARVVDLFSQERAVALAVIERETGDNVSPAIRTIITNELEALREVNFLVPPMDPSRNTVDVTVVGVADEGADPTIVASNAALALQEFLAASRWGQPSGVEEPTWKRVTKVYHQDLSAVLNNTIGFGRWTTLTVGVNGGAQAATDQNIIGIAPVTTSGVINMTVTAP